MHVKAGASTAGPDMSGPSNVADARRALEDAVQTLRANGGLVKSSHANLSVRLQDGRLAMTRRSTVADLEAHDPNALCVVDLSGAILEGDVDPAMHEVIAMHARLYHARSDVGAVIHTHAPHLTAFAIAHKPLELVHEPMLRVGLGRAVPVVPWAPRGSDASVDGIVDAAKADPGIKAVLLANHGVLAFARTAAQAARVLGTLEEAASLAIMAAALGGAKALPAEAAHMVEERRTRFSPGPT